jgi:hypothetical protein
MIDPKAIMGSIPVFNKMDSKINSILKETKEKNLNFNNVSNLILNTIKELQDEIDKEKQIHSGANDIVLSSFILGLYEEISKHYSADITKFIYEMGNYDNQHHRYFNKAIKDIQLLMS